MFKTTHLEGRLLYETDKVVCINVHINTNYDSTTSYLCQVLLSLVNKGHYSSMNISVHTPLFSLTEEEFAEEVNLGIKKYLETRQKLELD